MKNALDFIIRPAVAGLVFALAVLMLPAAVSWFPELARYVPWAEGGGEEAAALSYHEVIRKAAPAVVSINSRQVVEKTRTHILPQNPFVRLRERFTDTDNSLGSGVIISPDGYIITSYHIFEAAGPEVTQYFSQESTVTLHDGRVLPARPLAYNKTDDLVLLKVDAENLPFITPGSAAVPRVGDVVLAIGYPRNIGQSVSQGIVSALLKHDDSYVIQTDAAINQGNSGGALIDARGNLIGINYSLLSFSGGSEGIGFAIPAERADDLMASYIQSGPSGYLGISDSCLVDPSLLAGRPGGFYVIEVAPNGPADRAGIRPGDIITAADRIAVDVENYGNEFIGMLSSHAPGEIVNIQVFRGGEFRTFPVTLTVGEPVTELIPDIPSVEGEARPSWCKALPWR